MHEGHAMKPTNVRVLLNCRWNRPFLTWRAFLSDLLVAAAMMCSAKVLAQPVANCTAAPAGLVAWWPGDGNATNLIGGNPGSLENGATFTNGLVAQAFNLDGSDDYVDIGDLALLDHATEISVLAWIRKESADNSHAGFVGKYDNRPDYGYQDTFLLYNGESAKQNKGSFYVVFEDFDFAHADGVNDIPVQEWVFIAGTWRNSDGQIALYKNGALESSAAGGVGNRLNAHRLYTAKIGEWGVLRDSNYKFHGQIDEVAIFNRALSSDEIAAIYAAGSAGICRDSVHSRPAYAEILAENFEDNLFDERLSVQQYGEFNSAPGIKGVTNFGSIRSFGFGYSACPASCFRNFVSVLRVTFPSPTYVSRIAFSEMELYDNWGSHGSVFADGAFLNASDFGRFPNDRQPDSAFRRREIGVGAFVTNIVLEVVDITSSSEIFIDDLIVYGLSTDYPEILVPPQGAIVATGSNITLNVVASGAEPLSYQWLFRGTNLPGATAETLTISNAQTNHSGPYQVVLSNVYGTAFSSNAVLTVVPPPIITAQPQSQFWPLGYEVSFDVQATSQTPLTYQWLFNGAAIPDATNSSYYIPSLQSNHFGNYSVIVSNLAGVAVSSNAILSEVCAGAWDISADYSSVSNPNGVWSYGRRLSVDGDGFELFGGNWGSSGWYLGGTTWAPSLQGGPLLWPDDNQNGIPVVRWTCPESAHYKLSSRFTVVDGRGADNLVHVVVKGAPLFSEHIQNYGSSATFSHHNLLLNKNEYIDFVVEWAGGTYSDYGWTDVDAVICPAGPLPPVMVEGFEFGWNGWTIDNGVWQIGTGSAHSGSNYAGAVISGTYPPQTDSRLISPRIDLPMVGDQERLELRLWETYSYAGLDYGRVQLSQWTGSNWTDWITLTNATWYRLNPARETYESGWSKVAMDLTIYAGKPVRVAFYHSAESYSTYETGESWGWHIDDVEVWRGIHSWPGLETFENGWGDWCTDYGVWQIGTGSAHGGSNYAGAVISGNYPTQNDSRLISPRIDLPALPDQEVLELRFWEKYSYNGLDHGEVQLSQWAGGNWTDWAPLETPTSEYYSSGWSKVAIDITGYAGKSVRIAFHHTAASHNTYETGESTGWHIDDVEIWRGAPQWVGVESFENGWADWHTDFGLWQIGTGPAHGGSNYAGAVISGNYPPNTDSRLISTRIDLPMLADPARLELRFWERYSYNGLDYGYIQLSEWTGSNWTDWVTLTTNAGNLSAWSPAAINITPYAGRPMRVAFYHTAATYNTPATGESSGWQIDDVEVVTELLCAPASAGLVAWWPGDGNPANLVGTNHGAFFGGASTAPGIVDQAFRFNDSSSYVAAADHPLLSPHVGTNGELTVMAWILVTNYPGSQRPFVAKVASAASEYALYLNSTGSVQFDLWNLTGSSRYATAVGGKLNSNQWHHVTGTLRKGQFARLYLDGVQLAEDITFSGDTVDSNASFYIGGRGGGPYFSGLVDEVALFNRALTPNEIAGIYAAGATGMCKHALPPTILQSPTDQYVAFGSNIILNVTAVGTAPVSYQWRYNGSNLLDATAPTFVIQNSKTNHSGSYSVVVSNAYGVVTSAAAHINVFPLPIDSPIFIVSNTTISATSTYYERRNIVVIGAVVTNEGIHEFNSVLLTNGATLRHLAADTNGLRLRVTQDCVISSDSAIRVDGLGFPSHTGPGRGQSRYFNQSAGGAGGAGYGGDGGDGSVPGGVVYGSPQNPLDPGSGGGYAEWNTGGPIAHPVEYGGAGGGVIQLVVSGNCVVDGSVTANGFQGRYGSSHFGEWAGGGGSGGSVWLQAATLLGRGQISADGGRGGSSTPSGSSRAGGGGGGRIALYYSCSSFTGLVAVRGGTGSQSGQAGTLHTSTTADCPNIPRIIGQPQSQLALIGSNVTFSVIAGGDEPLGYQWRFNGGNLVDGSGVQGSQLATLTVANVQSNHSGNYTVVISNAFGTVTSSVATLLVVSEYPHCCKEILQAGITNDGVYPIDPDGSGIGEPINVKCLMSLSGGGWTQLTTPVANSPLNTNSHLRAYLYHLEGTTCWYRTPISRLVWDWTTGKDLYGEYFYSCDGAESSFIVTPSGEYQLYGVGGSSGPYFTPKCLIYYWWCYDPDNAGVQLCQDYPGIFGGACQCGVTVYIREELDTNGPIVLNFEPTGPTNSNISLLRVEFDEEILSNSFTAEDITIITPGGTVDPGNIFITAQSAQVFDISLPLQTNEGTYTIIIGPIISDLSTNSMAAASTNSFVIDKTPPHVVSMNPTGEVAIGTEYIDVTFNEAIAATSFTPDDVLLTRAGNPINIASVVSVADNIYRVSFTTPLAGGIHNIAISPDISDLAGNLMINVFRGQLTIHAPDLIVTNIVALGQRWTDQQFNVTWRDYNFGGAPMSGPWVDYVYLSLDIIPESHELVASNIHLGPLAARGGFEQSHATITAPSTPGTYWIIVVGDGLSSVVEDVGELNNTNVSPRTIVIEPYSVSVSVPPEFRVAPAGAQIPLRVQTFDPNDSRQPRDVPAVVRVKKDGVLRSVSSVMTDADGMATVYFDSLPGDVGLFEVYAHRPSEPEGLPQDSFVLTALALLPLETNHLLVADFPQTNRAEIINLSPVAVSNFTWAAEGLVENFITHVTVPENVPANSTSIVEYVLLATNDLIRAANGAIRVTSGEGASATLALDLAVAEAISRLVAHPDTLRATVVRGSNAFVSFELVNAGGASSGDLTTLLPNLRWLSVVSGRQITSLLPSDRTNITLGIAPPMSVPLGPVSGSIVIASEIASVRVPFEFQIVSSRTGGLRVTAVDEFTYYDVGSPKVTNATVVLMNPWDGTTVRTGRTDSTGALELADLPESYYRIEVSAPGHDSYRSTIAIRPDRVLELTAFLPRRLVTYNWTVTPTDFEDQYIFTLRTTFETHVPVPVITVEPPSIDLARITNETTINLRVSNHGLVAARGLTLHFGTHPAWRLTTAVTNIGDLGPLSSVEVPLNIQRIQLPPESGPCEIDAHLDWWFPCGPEYRYYRVPIIVFNASEECRFRPPQPPPPPPQPPPPGGEYVPYDPPAWDPPPPCTAGCSPEFPHVVFPEFELDLNFCDPCLLAAAGCAINLAGEFTPLGDYLTGWQLFIDCVVDRRQPECIEGILGLIGDNDSTLETVTDCICGITDSCPSSGPVANFVQGVCSWLDNLGEPIIEILGDPAWLAGAPRERHRLGDFLSALRPHISAGSEEGQTISNSELDALLSQTLPSQLQSSHVQALSQRWNRTVEYWQIGRFYSTNVPSGESQDFIALDRLQSKWATAKAGLLTSLAAGNTDRYDAASQALEFIRAEHAPQEGACARVRLQIDQRAVVTRDAFTAAFEMNNFTDFPVEDISLVLDIRDTNGQPANELFGFRVREVEGFGPATNGGPALSNGILPGHFSGRAVWIIVPATNAAPEVPTTYWVGGTLSYYDGEIRTVRLVPERIVVHPTPILRVTYFLQTEVYGDEPSTPEIEPREPFALGLMIQNTGRGTARNMAITSSQPQITDNEMNLLVDFEVIGTQVGNQPVSPSLTAHLGNILPDSNVVAIWQMTSSLSGRFLGYEATYRHVDDLGNPNISLIETIAVRALTHVVQADTPGSDDVPDFLVNDSVDNGDLPDTLYLSEGAIEPVTATTDATVTLGTNEFRFTVTPTFVDGWNYLRIADPSQGDYRLVEVVRSNGSRVLLHKNAWTTHRVIGTATRQHFFHLLDYSGADSYELVYVSIPVDTIAPTSSVAALPATNITTEIPVRWSGEDNSAGSGVSYFDIYVSVGGAPYVRWLSNTTLRGAVYLGSNHTYYAFYSIATDVARNREQPPSTPDAQTFVSVTNTVPRLEPMPNFMIDEGDLFCHPLIAIDTESPPQQLTFNLVAAPDGAQIDRDTGLICWQTGEAHGDSTNQFTVRVTDNASPPLSDTTTFWVIVKDVNSPPRLEPIVTCYAVTVGDSLNVTNRASDTDIPAQRLTFDLIWPTNSGARLNPTNGVFTWRPGRDFASSTQYFTIRVTDDGSPSMSDTETLCIIVSDYLEVGLGSTVMRTEQSSNVDITVYSSAGVTNICFILEYDETRLVNLAVLPVNPSQICLATVTPLSNNYALICLSTCPSELLVGTEKIADLHFTALPNSSAFVPLRFIDIAARRNDGQIIPSVAGRNGRVVIIGNEPLLELTRHADSSIWLTVYGKPGSSYQILSSVSLPAVQWDSFTTMGLLGLSNSVQVTNTSLPALFFHAYELMADQPVIDVLDSGDGSGDLVLFGTSGSTYIVETTTDLTGATDWTSTTVPLTNSFTVLKGFVPAESDVLIRATRQ